MSDCKTTSGISEPELFLASASPRRRELLDQIGVRHRCISHQIEETPAPRELPQDYVVRMAREKAASVLGTLAMDGHPVVLGADTIVVCENRILGKPVNRQSAGEMLNLLSGREHQVYSAVALASHDKTVHLLSETTVEFENLTAEQITRYWDSGESADKAGGYGIQGYGGIFVKRLRGSYSGVVGLPLFETCSLLQQFGIEYWQTGSVELDSD